MNQEKINNIRFEHQRWLANKEFGSRANFKGMDLREVTLRKADLREVTLRKADLREADLREADLRGADLREADLRGADLRGADLRGADLREANLYDADLNDAKIYIPMVCPSEGEFIGWKKVITILKLKPARPEDYICECGIAKLKIPQYAKRLSGTGRKCRASEAIVLDIISIRSGDHVLEGCSIHDHKFIYRVGETVKPEFSFDENRWNECSSGIHFFITRKESEEY